MGRSAVNIDFNAQKLRQLLAGKETFSERAEKYGVSRQAVNGWLESGRIPPRALLEIINDLDLSAEQTEELLKRPTKGEQEAREGEKRRWKITITVDEP